MFPCSRAQKKPVETHFFRQQLALKFCLPWTSFTVAYFFFQLVGRLSWTLAHWASDHCRCSTSCTGKLLAQLENLLVPDFNLDGTFFEFCNVLQLMNVVTTQVL